MILLLKALHIIALSIWCGMLVGMPLLLARSRRVEDFDDWVVWRVRAHLLYRLLATPAAVVATGSGIALIFAREVFSEWMLLKLLLVGLMVAGHALIGHVVLKSGEEGSHYRAPPAFPLLLVLVPPMLAVLVVVLLKPDLSALGWPEVLSEPRMRQLPLSDVPR
ncbi:MAG: CopD family protein [Pseudoxanthomonas suwonensis]|nr:CopD family protein [Pseudoxanthomonas suwonensis]